MNVRVSPKQLDFLKAVADVGEPDTFDMCREMNLNRQNVTPYARTLKDKGLLKIFREGKVSKYKLSSGGRRHLAELGFIEADAKIDAPKKARKPIPRAACLWLAESLGIAQAWKIEARHNGYRKAIPPSFDVDRKQGHNEQMAETARLRREAIVEYLKENPGSTGREIRNALGFSSCNLSDYMRRLKKDGLAHTKGRNSVNAPLYYPGKA